MKKLIAASLKQGVLINVVFVGLIICASFFAIPNIPVDRFPNIQFGEAEITTSYPGATPEEVEVLVTEEIEESLRSMNDLEYVRGSSSNGRSTVRIKFIDDTDYDSLYDEMRLRVLSIQNRLPTNNGKPLQPTFNKLDVDEWLPLIQVNLVSVDEKAPLDRRALVLLGEELRNRLSRVEGVKEVNLIGDRPEQFNITIDPKALKRHGVTLEEVTNAVRRSGGTIPGGSVDTPLGERVIRIDSRYRSMTDITNVIVREDGDGRNLTIGELVNIQETGPREISSTVIQSISGYESVGAKVVKLAEASAPDVKTAIEKAVAEFVASYPQPRFDVIYTEDNTIEISDGMGVLAQSLLLSVVLVMLLLFLFLGNRSKSLNTIVSALGVGVLLILLFSDSPLIATVSIGAIGAIVMFTCRAAVLAVSGVAISFLGALLVFWIMGRSLNEITLLGFILISGIIVDDAIIVIENIQRQRESGKSLIQAAIDGTAEVFWPVVSAGLSTMAAFLPLLMMTGSVGDFFSLVPIAVSTALAISLVEALIILPLHVVEAERVLGPDGSLQKESGSHDGLPTSGLIGKIAGIYDRALQRNLRHPYLAVAASIMLFFLAMGALVYSTIAPRYGMKPIVRSEFFPEDLSVLMLTMRGPNGTPLADTDIIAREASTLLREMGEDRIYTVTTFAGMQLDTTYKPSFGNNMAMMMIKLPPRDLRSFGDPRSFLTELREDMVQFAEERSWKAELRAAPTGPPTGLPVNVRISGADESAINRLASDLLTWMEEQATIEGGLLPGVIDLRDGRSDLSELWSFNLDQTQLSKYRISERSVQDFIATATDGIYVGEFRRHDGDIPIRVVLPEQVGQNPDDILSVPMSLNPQGRVVYFDDVGHMELSTIPSSLERRDFERLVTITGDFNESSPLSAQNVVDIVERWYQDHATLYAGAGLSFGGEAESTSKSYNTLYLAFILALVLIYGILAAQFRNYLQPILILSNVFFSFTGVVLVMAVLGIIAQLVPGIVQTERTLFTVNSFIAIIGLAGLVVNDAIVLIDFINKRRAEGIPVREAIILASHQRMRPIMLTTLTTIAGLLPMAIGLPEFSVTWGPFATSFIAGLAVATAMTLLIVPCLYLILDRWQSRAGHILQNKFPHLAHKVDEKSSTG